MPEAIDEFPIIQTPEALRRIRPKRNPTSTPRRRTRPLGLQEGPFCGPDWCVCVECRAWAAENPSPPTEQE
jgi:hypothetical protein